MADSDGYWYESETSVIDETDRPIEKYLKREGLWGKKRKLPFAKVPRLEAICVQEVAYSLRKQDIKEVLMVAEALQLNGLADQVYRFYVQEYKTKQVSSALQRIANSCPRHMKSLFQFVAKIGLFYEKDLDISDDGSDIEESEDMEGDGEESGDDEKYMGVQLVKPRLNPDSLPSAVVITPADVSTGWQSLKEKWCPVYRVPPLADLCMRKLNHGKLKMAAWIVSSIAKGRVETVEGLKEHIFNTLLERWKSPSSKAAIDVLIKTYPQFMIEVFNFAAKEFMDGGILRALAKYFYQNEECRKNMFGEDSDKEDREDSDDSSNESDEEKKESQDRANNPYYWGIQLSDDECESEGPADNANSHGTQSSNGQRAKKKRKGN